MSRLKYGKMRYLVVALVLTTLPLLMAACQEEKPSIKFANSDGQFGSVSIESGVAGFIIESLWGYPLEVVSITTPAWMAALPTGEVDVVMEGWEHSIGPAWHDKNISEGKMENLGPLLEGGPQMWIIPQWVHDQHGIETVADLKDKWELFKDPEDSSKGAFYNCPIGWMCEKINRVKLEAYGLDGQYNVISPGSGAALKAMLVAAQKKQEPVIGYWWSPTSLMGKYDWYIVKEPESTDAVWEKVSAAVEDPSLRPIDEASAFPDAPLNKLVWSGLKDKAPEAYEFLKKMHSSLDEIESTLGWAEDEDIKDTAQMRVVAHYIRTYQDNVKSWLTDKEWKKVDEALKDEGY